jgi:hypothetical protein
MKERLSLGLVAMLCVAFLASGAMGAGVYFSEALGVGEGAVPAQSVEVLPNTTLTLGIWSTADQDYDTTIGMNVVSADPVAVALGAGEVLNPELIWEVLGAPSGGFRWQDASVGNVAADQVSNMNAAHVTAGTGILGANDGTVPPLGVKDPLLDLDAGAFLLGTVTMTTSTEPGFSSELTINQEGTALFVNAGDQVFPDFAGMTVTVGVPEPSTLVLVAFGLIAMIGYGLKR